MNANQARSWNTNTVHEPVKTPKKVAVRVRKHGWITKGEKIIYSCVAFALIIVGIFIVSLSAEMDALNREVQQLEQTIQQQQLTNQSLAFEVEELSRPERIISFAKSHGLKIQNTEVKQAQNVESE